MRRGGLFSARFGLGTALLVGFASLTAEAYAQEAERRYELRIDRGSLLTAARSIREQTGVEIVYSFDLADENGLSPVHGQYTLEQAFAIMFEGTDLTGSLTESGMIVITRQLGVEAPYREADMNTETVKRGLLASVYALMFGAGGAVAQDADGVAISEASAQRQLDTIIVTATKRAQDIRDVPASISVISAEDIERRSLVNASDYLNSIPGVSFIDSGPGLNQAVIRGIGLSQLEQATVSTYFGEVPLTDSVSGASEIGGAATDLKLVDLERVEVLKGPQGTLFGSGAMGGVIRNVPAAPKLNVFEGDLTAGLALMSDSDDVSNSLTGVVNLPLVNDRLALRVVGYRFDTAGYIDRVSTPAVAAASATTGLPVDQREDVNANLYVGGRASLLFQATDDFKITTMVGVQRLEEEAGSIVDFTLGDYEISLLATPGVDNFSRDDFEFVNVVAEYDLNWATVLASFTHSSGEKVRQDSDELFFLGAPRRFSADKETDVAELRVASQLGGPLQFVGGLYYEEFSRRQNQTAEWGGDLAAIPFGLTPLPSSPGPNGLPVIFEFPVNRFEDLEQIALFGEVSYSVLPGLTVTGGARWFDFERDTNSLGNNFFGLSGVGTSFTEESDTNFKASVAYEPTEDSLLYFTWSEGFRLGAGQNPPPASVCDIDNDGNLDFTNAPLRDSVGSDSTTNYEVGGKFSLLNNRLTVNAAAFRIDWENIPVTVFDTSDTCPGNLIVTANAGEARSQGVELDGAIGALEGLQLFFAVAYTDTELLGDVVGTRGDRLPLSPEFSYSIGLQYDTEVAGNAAYVRSDYSYIDGFASDTLGFSAPTESYARWNMRAGIDFDPVRASIYVNNLLDSNADLIGFGTTTGRRLAPRVIGVDLGYRF